MTTEKVFRCKGCGTDGSIVEVQLIPSIQTVRPDPATNHTPFEDVDYGGVTDWREAMTVLGFACRNESCEHWHGNWGTPSREEQVNAHGRFFEFVIAEDLSDIAEEIEDTGVNPEAGNPVFYYPIQ